MAGNVPGAARATWVRYVIVYILGTLMLSAAAIYNGYPLVYWDSGSYLRAFIELHYLPDRPVTYSILIGLLHWRFSLWPVVFGQSALMVFVIERTLSCLVPRSPMIVPLGVLLCLTVATSLPWFTDQITPLFLAPIVVLSVYMLGVEQSRMGRWEGLAFFCILTAAQATHYSHIALTIGLIVLLAILSLTLRWLPMRNLVPVILATVLAAGSIYAVNYAARREIVFGPANSILLLDRLLVYRTAQSYLARACPEVHYEICPYLDELNNLPPVFGELMWNDTGVISKLGGSDHYQAEASRLTHDIIMDAPIRNMWLMLGGAADLLVHFPTGDEFGTYEKDTQIYRILSKYFGREFAAFQSSREQQGTLTFGVINAVDVPAGYVSMVAAMVLLLIAIGRNDTRLSTFLTAVLAALFGNAFICGGLSSGDAHYQSRMMPLVTLAAMIGALRLFWPRETGHRVPSRS